jgi:hypothetical protein
MQCFAFLAASASMARQTLRSQSCTSLKWLLARRGRSNRQEKTRGAPYRCRLHVEPARPACFHRRVTAMEANALTG